VVTALGSGTAYALSAELGGPLSKAHDALSVATVTMTVAAAVLVVGGLAVAVSRREPLGTPDAASWLLVLYLGLGTMALAYVLLFAGLRTTSSGTAVVASLLEPVTAVAIAVVFLGEHLTAGGVLGALLIVSAIASLGLGKQAPAPQ
jgi:DME family drug/metabolite transporter